MSHIARDPDVDFFLSGKARSQHCSYSSVVSNVSCTDTSVWSSTFQERIELISMMVVVGGGKKVKLGANAMQRVAAGAHLPTPWLFEPAKRPDERADYCLDCSFLPQCKDRVLVFTLEWSGARLLGEQW